MSEALRIVRVMAVVMKDATCLIQEIEATERCNPESPFGVGRERAHLVIDETRGICLAVAVADRLALVCLEVQDTAIGCDPKRALSIFVDGPNLSVSLAKGNIAPGNIRGERTGGWIKSVQAFSVRPAPVPASMVLKEGQNRRAAASITSKPTD